MNGSTSDPEESFWSDLANPIIWSNLGSKTLQPLCGGSRKEITGGIYWWYGILVGSDMHRNCSFCFEKYSRLTYDMPVKHPSKPRADGAVIEIEDGRTNQQNDISNRCDRKFELQDVEVPLISLVHVPKSFSRRLTIRVNSSPLRFASQMYFQNIGWRAFDPILSRSQLGKLKVTPKKGWNENRT